MNRLLWCLVMTGLFSCGTKPVFEASCDISPTGWTYGDAVVFKVPVEDTTGLHELVLTVGHQKSFSFENMYLRIETMYPDSSTRQSVVSIPLANPMGTWMGQCGSRGCSIDITLLASFLFPRRGPYTFRIEQFSRQDTLMGISSLALKVYRLQEAKG